MATVPLMRRYKLDIYPLTKHRQMKEIFYTYPFYRKLPSLLRNKLALVFTSGELLFVVPIKSNADGGIFLMGICDNHGIPEELIYDNTQEEKHLELSYK